ncbi:MAG: CPBP family intramembrane metalloprotease [Breznakibacter sp.]
MNFLERALDGQNQWWKYLVMFLVTFLAAQFIGSIPLAIVIIVKTIQLRGNISEITSMDLSVFGIHQNLLLALVMFTFVVSLLMMVVMLKPMHQRSFSETINGTHAIRWNRFFSAFGIWFVISGIALAVAHITDPGNFTVSTTIGKFIPLIIISLVFIPIQTTYEELFMRGYFAQGVGAWTRSRVWAIMVPSVIFALMHSFNPEIKAYGFWIVMPQYLIFGLVFGLVSVLDDGIETAMGAHAANNIFLSVFVTNQDSVLQTPALLTQLTVNPMAELLSLIILSAIFVAVLALIYKWDFGILTRKIEQKPTDTPTA